MVSESEISVQGHGVHTAYEEMVQLLDKRRDVQVIRGKFREAVDCDIIHIHTVGPRVWRKLFQKKPKKVITAHVLPDSFVGSIVGARIWRGLATLYLRWFYNRADMVIAVSDATAQNLRSMGVRVPIKTVYNTIDTEKYQKKNNRHIHEIRQKLNIQDDQFVVIGVGQVQPRKRVDVFVELAKRYPDIAFVWVGGIPFGHAAASHHAMDRLMHTSQSNLHFTGIVPLEEIADYYHAADVFLLPSTQETFGLVVVEAAASGLPVVLRNIDDYQSTFAAHALLVNEQDFGGALVRLRDDQDWYRHCKQLSKQLAEAYDSTRSGDIYVDLYHQLLAG